MVKPSRQRSALSDVRNALFEIGVVDSPAVVLQLGDDLRDTLGLDSQELVSLAVSLSSLATSAPALKEDEVCTVTDLVEYVAMHRDIWLPTDLPYVLQGSATINKDLGWVQSCIADYEKWPEILAHVTTVEPEYDDGRFQYFRMHFEELNTREHYFVQSSRYVNLEAGIIDFTQPKPPVGFKVHKGGWRFKALDANKTELIAYHAFDLDDGVSIEDSMALIRKHIHAALTTWTNHGNK
jgi:acyl carrier protein